VSLQQKGGGAGFTSAAALLPKGRDEFDAIGLGKHRDNERWIEEMTSAAPENCLRLL
jgi:hypothetical protein